MQNSTQPALKITDLFSGAGGLSQGFIEASSCFAPVQAVELDTDAASTYASNFTSADVFNGEIATWLLKHRFVETDIVIGGPPCQGFSTLGRRNENDEKNLLWTNFVSAVSELRPKYFVMENVPQFLKTKQGEDFASEFEKGKLQSYSLSVSIVNSKDYGSPQSRKRLIALGSRCDMPKLTMPAGTTLTPSTVRDAFAGIPSFTNEINLPKRSTNAFGSKRPGPFRSDELHLTRNYSDLSLTRFTHIPTGGNRFDIPDKYLAPCWRKHKTGSADVMGRMHLDRPSVTIRTEFHKPEKGRYLHPTEDRAITHHEAARLMGFPDSYLWVGSKLSIARQIGNAVPVDLGKAIGREILSILT